MRHFLSCLPLFYLGACTPCQPNAFEVEISEYRVQWLKKLTENPYFPLTKPEEIKSLRFFPANQSFSYQCEWEPSPDEIPFGMPTTDGTTAQTVKFGRLTFKDGNLDVFKIIKPGFGDYFFIPFRDQTNGHSTYAGGRYLDFTPTSIVDGKATLDFNKCYNPWCHYSDDFPCPIPPPENHLQIAIPVGERMYQPRS